MKFIFVHGTGHTAVSWEETISNMKYKQDIVCPELSLILNGKEASFPNLCSAFAEYCNQFDEQIHLCGLSLGGVLALDYALKFPEKVQSLVLIGTPYKVPKFMLSVQNVIFRFFPEFMFDGMAFDKNATSVLTNSMRKLDFTSQIKTIQCPTLVLCGEKDRANKKSAYYLAENIPHAELRMIKRTGHIVNEKNPKVLAEILDSWR